MPIPLLSFPYRLKFISFVSAFKKHLQQTSGNIGHVFLILFYNQGLIDVSLPIVRTNLQLIYCKKITSKYEIYILCIFQMTKSNFSPLKSRLVYPFPASMSSGSDKVDTVADGFFRGACQVVSWCQIQWIRK